jgi:photosystem II stability/assembly factor-like uncharacterized protein
LYWRENSNAQWSVRSPINADIVNAVVIASGHYLVAVKTDNVDNMSPLYASTDSGKSWQRVVHNFGREFNDPILRLAFDDTTEKLYATSTVALAVSDKNAMDWTLLSGFWDGAASGLRMLRIDKVSQNVWFSGQGAIENGTLSKYNTATNNTDNWQGLLPDPSTYRGGLIHPVDLSTVMFSGEGGIVLSNDNGMTWSFPLGDVNYTFYNSVILPS